mgnify:CR=1 FL=1
MSGPIELLLASPPERDFLSCELLVDGEVFAELCIQKSGLIVELQAKHDGAAWQLPYDELLKALAEAKAALSDVDTSVII